MELRLSLDEMDDRQVRFSVVTGLDSMVAFVMDRGTWHKNKRPVELLVQVEIVVEE